MELRRIPNASTFVSFPMITTAGASISGLTPTAKWLAYSDTSGPKAQGNPGFRTLSGLISEMGATSVYQVALAAAELPTASPYVMLLIEGTGAATQYLLIRTSTRLELTSPIDNSEEKAVARMYMAATNYLDAAVTSRLAPTVAARTIDVDASGGVEIGSFQTGAITTAAFTAGAIDAAAIAADAIGDAELAADGASKYADALLQRNVESGSSAGRTVREALYYNRNKVAVSAGTLTVYKTNDTTASWTATVATVSYNSDITSVDPS